MAWLQAQDAAEPGTAGILWQRRSRRMSYGLGGCFGKAMMLAHIISQDAWPVRRLVGQSFRQGRQANRATGQINSAMRRMTPKPLSRINLKPLS